MRLMMGLLLPGARCTILFLLTVIVKVTATRPEIVLSDILTKPFVPRQWASLECIRAADIYLRALERYTPWALQMYDSSVKIPSGLITGNYKQLGNFDECLKVRSDHGFIGQACNAAVHFEIAKDDGAPREMDIGDLFVNVAIASNATKWTSGNTIVYEWMWCVPSTCNYTEVQEALEIALDPLKVEGRVDVIVSVPKESCHTVETDRVTWDIADWCYTFILVLFVLIIIISTVYDFATQRHLITGSNWKDNSYAVILTSFSFYTNGRNLLRTDRRRGESIGCLDGLRYLSICWIIYGHTHYNEVVSVKMNLTQVPRMHHDWSSMLVLNGNIVTDTFFLLSGILLAYTEMLKKKRDCNWRFDMIGLYIHRYMRLTPAYAMMIGFYATLFHKFGSGPYWDTWVGSNKRMCRENWWTNLLYINNYVNVPDMCMSQSWYLSTDMQLVWLSPIILYPMLKFRSLFFAIILGIGLFLSILVPFVLTYSLKLTGTMLYYKNQTDVVRVYLEIYTRVYNRFGPYIIGLGLGYLLHRTRSYNVKLRTWYVICGWLIAVVSGLAVVFGPRGMYYDTHVYDRLEASLYAGCHRQVFALAVAWIIFCCVHGYAGPVNHFLSWRGWIPLSKLTYCAYLSHYLFLLSDIGSVRTAGSLTAINVIRTFFANLVFTMILSALWSLCFEMPFMIIDRALFSKCKQRSTHSSNHKSRQQSDFGSLESGKEICPSLHDEPSSKNDIDNNDERFDITRYISTSDVDYPANPKILDIDRETNLSRVSNNIKTDIYVIGSVNSRAGGYVNVDFYRTFDEDEHTRANSSAKGSTYGSINTDCSVSTGSSQT